MPIYPENIERPRAKLLCEAVRARRHGTGQWSLVVRITGTVELSGGRTLEPDRETALLERQIGSLPRGRRPGQKPKAKRRK
jgi:hypothetical protein